MSNNADDSFRKFLDLMGVMTLTPWQRLCLGVIEENQTKKLRDIKLPPRVMFLPKPKKSS